MNEKVIQTIKDEAIPLVDMEDIISMSAVIGVEKYVLLGESSHNTEEFYKNCPEISKK